MLIDKTDGNDNLKIHITKLNDVVAAEIACNRNGCVTLYFQNNNKK